MTIETIPAIGSSATSQNVYGDSTHQTASASAVSDFENLMLQANTDSEYSDLELKDYIVKSIVDKTFDPIGDMTKDMIEELAAG